jgi:plasmid stability protein
MASDDCIDYDAINADGRQAVASVTIRNLDDAVKSHLRIRAAAHGRSMEEEARNILRAALAEAPQDEKNLGAAINALFKPFGGVELPQSPRAPIREPPSFEE